MANNVSLPLGYLPLCLMKAKFCCIEKKLQLVPNHPGIAPLKSL